MTDLPLLWLGFTFLLLVHWLVGNPLARLGMFLVCATALIWFIKTYETQPTAIPPGIFFGVIITWWLTGIPRRYRKRANQRLADAFSGYFVDLRARERLADRDTP